MYVVGLIYLDFVLAYFAYNHNNNKILKSDWLSTVLISALIQQSNRTLCVPCAIAHPFLNDCLHF